MNFPFSNTLCFRVLAEPSYQNCPLIHSRAVSNGWGSFKDFVPNDKSTTLWNLPQQITRKSSYLPCFSSSKNLPVDAISKSKFQAVLFSGFQLPSSLPFLQVKLISCWESQLLHLWGELSWLVPVVPSEGQVTTRMCTSLTMRGFRRKNTFVKKTSFATITGNGDNPKHIYNRDVVEKGRKKRNMRSFLLWDLLPWKPPRKPSVGIHCLILTNCVTQRSMHIQVYKFKYTPED